MPLRWVWRRVDLFKMSEDEVGDPPERLLHDPTHVVVTPLPFLLHVDGMHREMARSE